MSKKTEDLKKVYFELNDISSQVISKIRKITGEPLPIDKDNWLTEFEEEIQKEINEIMIKKVFKHYNYNKFKH